MKHDRKRLRARIDSGQLLIAPGIFDGLSARIADRGGFDALYLSGYGVSASLLAQPDNGHLTADNMTFRIDSICNVTTTPVIADADTGFGGVEETRATVRAYEAAGAAGIQIEDQQVPKICGHIAGREVVPREAAVAKITAAIEARTDPDFIVVARTDAREQHGLEEAIARGRAFAEAGADIIFVESPENLSEFTAIGQALGDWPLLANMVEGGRSPLVPRAQLAEMGFNMAIYPVAALAAIAATLKKAYAQIGAADVDLERVDFSELSQLVGFDAPQEK